MLKNLAPLLAALFASAAFAEDQRTTVSSTTAPDNIVPVWESPLYLTISPGVFTFEESPGQSSSRLMSSLIFDWNFSPSGPVETPIQYGIESGIQYSHLGGAGSNFFGTGSNNGGGGNLFVIPVDLWAGYHWDNSQIMASLHTGASLYLVSDESSINLGRDNDGQGGAAEIYPNLGFRIGWDTGDNVAISFRNDWTLAPNYANYTGMLGATIPLS